MACPEAAKPVTGDRGILPRAPVAAWTRLRALASDALLAPVREAGTMAPGLREGRVIARESRLAIAVAVLLVVGRSAVLAWWDQAAFNSDHAVVGLMAKHLAEGRAFPLFFYGQSYMLGVEAWLAAPIFLVAGPSVLGLHLPLIAINALVACLLIVLLRRELGLGALTAFAASLVFVLAPPATALGLVEPNGGSVEPFLYVLLLWVLRARPALFGIVLGFGFLHREFTAYGLFALVVLWLAAGAAITRERVRHVIVAGAWCCAVVGAVQVLKVWSSPLGPGTHVGSAGMASTNLGELWRRFCWSPARLPSRFHDLWEWHLGVLFGTGPHSLGMLGIRSRMAGQGTPGASLLMTFLTGAAVLRVLVRGRRRAAATKTLAFAAYLILVGGVSMVVYWVSGCDRITPDTLRYDLLGLLLVVGLAAMFFRVEPSRWLRAVGVMALVAWAAVSAESHFRLLSEYILHPPQDGARQAAETLASSGVTHATGNYWVAYRLTFLSGERVTIASDSLVRISEYQQAARASQIYVREQPCEGGTHLAGRFFRCPAR